MSKKTSMILINSNDNVAVASDDLQVGACVSLPNGDLLTLVTDVPRGHKVALIDMTEGQEIIKYGEVIGWAKKSFPRGTWVHTHNMGGAREGGKDD